MTRAVAIICVGIKNGSSNLNEEFRVFVKLGNDSKMMAKGKGSIKLEIGGIMQVIAGVFWIPELRNNLLSVDSSKRRG